MVSGKLQEGFCQRGPSSAPCPGGTPLPAHALTGGPLVLAGILVQSPVGSLLISSGSWCTQFCLCPPRLESLFPPVLWRSYSQILLTLKARFPGDSQSLCWIARLGSPIWCLESSQQCANFFGVILLQSVGHPPGGYGICLYCDCAPPTISLQLLLCLWAWGIFFW